MLPDAQATTPPVRLSHPVVEAGLYDHGQSSALVLGNFTYARIPELQVTLDVGFKVATIRSAEKGRVQFSQNGRRVEFTLSLGISDIVRID